MDALDRAPAIAMTIAAVVVRALATYLLIVAAAIAALRLARTRASRVVVVPPSHSPWPSSNSAPAAFGATRGQLRPAVLAAVVGAIISPLLGVAAFGWVSASKLLRRRQRVRTAQAAIATSITEAIDLFGVMLQGGHTVASCVSQAGEWLDGAVGATFQWCDEQTGQGKRLADLLETLPERLGPNGAPLRPLVGALIANERYGAPIATSLAQLGADTRADQRRRAEAIARRLPVVLLFPLVVCVLPAFMLLTVVPVLSETLGTLDLLASPE